MFSQNVLFGNLSPEKKFDQQVHHTHTHTHNATRLCRLVDRESSLSVALSFLLVASLLWIAVYTVRVLIAAFSGRRLDRQEVFEIKLFGERYLFIID